MMTAIDAKALKTFCDAIENFFCMESPAFRQKFNSHISATLLKGYETGDFSWVTRIIKSIPDENIRRKITAKIIKTLPVTYREKTESLVKDSKRWVNYTAQDFQNFLAVRLNDFIEEKDGKIALDKVKIEPTEFVDFVLDTITMNRNHFSINDLEKVNETLALIKDRLEKKMAKRA